MELWYFLGIISFLFVLVYVLYRASISPGRSIKPAHFAFSMASEWDADDKYFDGDEEFVVLWYDASCNAPELEILYYADVDLTESPYDGFYTNGRVMIHVDNGYQKQKYIIEI